MYLHNSIFGRNFGQSNATFVNSSVQNEYEDFKRTIESQIAEIKRRPSFDGTTITIQAGDTKELNDTNWCQNRYMDTFYERVYNRLCTLIRKECVEDG